MRLIVRRIHDQECVPFLGAAANVSNETYKGLKLGVEVAGEFIKEMDEFVGRDRQNLARVTLEYEFPLDRKSLVDRLKEILPDQNCEPSPLLKTLARLPFKLIITTNYDRLLEKALKKAAFRTLVQPSGGFPVTRETRLMFEELEGYDGLILYKIHGSFDVPQGAEQPPPVIITEDDYIEFLAVLGQEKERIGVPNLIVKKLTPSTLLFLGYSLEDWDFRTLYKGWIERLPTHAFRKSFAIQKNPPEFWVKFWYKKGIEIYNVDLYEFAGRLEESYKAEYGSLAPKPRSRT